MKSLVPVDYSCFVHEQELKACNQYFDCVMEQQYNNQCGSPELVKSLQVALMSAVLVVFVSPDQLVLAPGDYFLQERKAWFLLQAYLDVFPLRVLQVWSLLLEFLLQG